MTFYLEIPNCSMKSIQPTIQIFIGEQIKELSEKRFLGQLCRDLDQLGTQVLIFANFFAGRRNQQIDFMVVLPTVAAWYIELKCWEGPASGPVSGLWKCRRPDGKWEHRDNPFAQALSGSQAISDDMMYYAQKSNKAIPTKGKFYYTFKTLVCFFPARHPESELPTDYRVDIVGYDTWLSKVAKTSTSTDWTMDDWMGFIESKNLRPATRDGVPLQTIPPSDEAAVNLAKSIYEQYLSRAWTNQLILEVFHDLDRLCSDSTYWCGFQLLSESDRLRLLRLSPPSSYTTISILDRSGWLERREVALTFLEEIALVPPDDVCDGWSSLTIQAFIDAWIGCSRFLNAPPAARPVTNDSERAWRLIGHVVFWLAKKPQDLSISNALDQACRDLTQLPFEAIDCLWRLGTMDGGAEFHRFDLFPIKHILEYCASPILEILEFGLRNSRELAVLGVDDMRHNELGENRMRFVLQLLGAIGNENTIRYLSILEPREDIGLLASASIRAIRYRNSGGT